MFQEIGRTRCLAELVKEQPGILKSVSNGNLGTSVTLGYLYCKPWLHHWVPLSKAGFSSINRDNNTNYVTELWG